MLSSDFDRREWENICRHCGRCCLIKIEDADTGRIYFTNIICRYYDCERNICTVYDKRCQLVPECLKLTPENVDKLPWMPKVCAYRKLFDKSYKEQNLTPLKGRVVSETAVKESAWEDYIIAEEDL